jgi:NOL1/NOP2/fmu family ribosome biogenesis protein
MPLTLQEEWGIRQTITDKNGYAYRCWPHLAKGEGFFLAVFRKHAAEEGIGENIKIKNTMPASTLQSLDGHIQSSVPLSWMMQGKYIAALLPQHQALVQLLMQYLRVRYAGVEVGQLLHDVLIPEPALALASAIHPNMELVELDEKEAIAFLRKDSFIIASLSKGWQWVGYQSLGLGWIKSLGNRINNYHPSEWRIRMNA